MRMCLSLALVLMTSVAVASEQTRSIVTDVALQDGGVLKGQLLDTAGAPQAKSQVVLSQNGKVLAATTSDADGKFALANVKAGVYQIETPKAGGVYRVWAPRTAPPAAAKGVLMIGDKDIVRGQIGGDEYGPAIRGAVAGGLIGGGTYWALDYNKEGS